MYLCYVTFPNFYQPSSLLSLFSYFPCEFFFLRSRELFVSLVSKVQGTALLIVIHCVNCNSFEIKNNLL